MKTKKYSLHFWMMLALVALWYLAPVMAFVFVLWRNS